MSGASTPQGLYRRQLARALERARPLLEPGEEVRGAGLAQRRVSPIYPLLMMGVGAGIFVPGISSPDAALPEAVRLYVGLPLFAAGTALMAWAGQAVVIVTDAAAYVVASASFPGQAPHLVARAPLTDVRVDPERGVSGVGSERLWPLPFRRGSLRDLARLVPEAPRLSAEGTARPRRRRWLIALAAVIGLFGVLVVIGALTETDEEKIEQAVVSYNEALVGGDGEAACAQLTARAREQVVEAATSSLGVPPDPPDCATAVEAVHGRAGGAAPRVNPEVVTEVEVQGDRATARSGAPFAYQLLPLVAEEGDWRLANLRAPWVIRDAPASDPPDASEFAARAHAVCADVSYRAIPVSARVLSGPARSGDPVGPLRTLARLDRKVADGLADLTPPAGGRPDLTPALQAWREIAAVREGLADAFEANDDGEVERWSRRFEPARRELRRAVGDAGLTGPLSPCAS